MGVTGGVHSSIQSVDLSLSAGMGFDQTSEKVQRYADTSASYVIPNSLTNTFDLIASHSRPSDMITAF